MLQEWKSPHFASTLPPLSIGNEAKRRGVSGSNVEAKRGSFHYRNKRLIKLLDAQNHQIVEAWLEFIEFFDELHSSSS